MKQRNNMMQGGVEGLPLFEPERCDPKPTLPDARADRDQAMASVEDHAGDEFREKACVFIVAYLLSHGPTAGEDLTDACKRSGIVPHDDRAFGPVYMRLSRDGLIEKAGYVPRRKGHGTGGGSVWQLRKGTP